VSQKKTIIAVSLIALLLSNQAFSDDGEAVRPVRTETPPKIDGRLDDPLWRTIEPISGFRQQEPADGEPATERTEVRIAYDSRNLYFAIRAYDREPSKLVNSVYERDGFMPENDSFLIAIDSNDDSRTAFVFQFNALGARADAEVTENGRFNQDWDAIWNYKARIDDQGYTIEAVIPFFVLRFTPSEEVDMGLLILRRIRRKNETAYWPYITRDYYFFSVSQYGRMLGLRGIERGKNLEIKPYAIAGYSKTQEGEDYEYDAGLDVKWGVTPNFTVDLTANTDFAQVESDALQVNLTRFSLFYPEKREFFLESADLFQFGLPQRAEVFFSRRIGLRGNREVPIIGGARAYGLVGDTNIGLMTMQTDSSGGIDGENFSVARIKHNVLGRSYVGGIFTSRSGLGAQKDITLGGDYMFIFGNNITLHGTFARSNLEGEDEGNWLGVVGAYQYTDLYIWEVRYDDIGKNFDPGMGFVIRPDQRTLTLYGVLSPRPGWSGVRQLAFENVYRRIENHAGVLETRSFIPAAGITFQTEDNIRASYEDTYDFVPYSFYIAPGVIIPSGDYTNRSFTIEGITSRSRRISTYGVYWQGSFYGGDITGGYLGLLYKPASWLHLSLEDSHNRVVVPGGEFDSNISRLFISYYLSPDIMTRVAAQYSSLFDDFVLNFRLRWIYAPGSEAWLVYNEGRRFDLPGSSLRDQAVILKIVHNFNF